MYIGITYYDDIFEICAGSNNIIKNGQAKKKLSMLKCLYN